MSWGVTGFLIGALVFFFFGLLVGYIIGVDGDE